MAMNVLLVLLVVVVVVADFFKNSLKTCRFWTDCNETFHTY